MPVVIGIPKPYPVAYTSPTLASGTLNANATQVSGTGTTSKIFPIAGSNSLACFLAAPGTGRLEGGETFFVRAAGEVYTAGSYTVAVSLYAVNATTWANGTMASQLTPASWTLLYTAGTPVSVANTTALWRLDAQLQGGSLSGVMNGSMGTEINGTVAAPVTLTTALSLATTTPGGMQVEPPIVFAVGLTFGTSNAANVAQLNYFILES